MMYTGPNDNSNAIPAHMSVGDAIRAGNTDVLESFLREGTNPNQTDSTGLTLLHYAVLTNQAEALTLLIKHGADVTQKSNAGDSPLHVAAQGANAAIIHLLIENGANELRLNGTIYNAIDIANYFENHSAIQALKIVEKIRQLVHDVYEEFLKRWVTEQFKSCSIFQIIFSAKCHEYFNHQIFAKTIKKQLFFLFYKKSEALLSCFSCDETYSQLCTVLAEAHRSNTLNPNFLDSHIIYNNLIFQAGRAMAEVNNHTSSMGMPFDVAQIVASHLPIYNAQLPEHKRLFRSGYNAQKNHLATQNMGPIPMDVDVDEALAEPPKPKRAKTCCFFK